MPAPEDDSFAASRARRGEFSVTRHEAEDGIVRLELAGELDLSSAGELEHALNAAADAEGVIVDLRPLDFIDSTGLRLIIQFDESTRDAGLALEIWDGPPAVSRVFEISGARAQLPFRQPR